MNILIVANGTIKNRNFYKKIIKKASIIIAADGGADNCIKLGISPNYVIGDLDSISNKAKEKFKKLVIYKACVYCSISATYKDCSILKSKFNLITLSSALRGVAPYGNAAPFD